MRSTADELRRTVETVMPMLREISDADASVPRAPGKWTGKQVLGHLIDSACNNQQKFVRTMQAPLLTKEGWMSRRPSRDRRGGSLVADRDGVVLSFPGYEQNHWVESQHYNTAAWDQLVSLWQAYNTHLAHVIEHADPAHLSHKITVSDHGTFTLEFIMTDYVDHLKHHLRQILPEALAGKFENSYIPEL